MEPALYELTYEGAPDDEVAVILRLAEPYVTPDRIRVIARFGSIITCRLRRGDIPSVHAHAGTLSMKAPRPYSPTPFEHDLASSGETDGPDIALEPGDYYRPQGDLPTGNGVILAHIDWGLDIAHRDFRHPDGRTRILALWDQSRTYDPAVPNRYGYGRIYTSSDIDHALAQADPYAALGYSPWDSDTGFGSHGTHTMGISSGNGRSGGPVGLAPDASIMFSHLGAATGETRDLLGDSVAFLESLDFFSRVAGSRPLVVNASLGRQAGEHDGQTLTERGMDAFLLDAPGRAIVQSVGNYFSGGIHTTDVVHPGKNRAIHIEIVSGIPNEVDLWYPGVDRFGFTLSGPPGVVQTVVAPGDQVQIKCDGIAVGRVYHRIGDPNNNDNQFSIFLSPNAPSGPWQIDVFGHFVNDGRFHAWIERSSLHATARTHFAHDEADPTTTLGTICNGVRTIAVGAYDAHAPDRAIGRFSSAGPTRDNRELKPELVAPGVRVVAARSRPRNAVPGAPVPELTCMSGSSMASPMVAGTIALIFAAAGRPLEIDETRSILLSSLDEVPTNLDPVEQLRHGSGYLNTTAAVRLAACTRVAGVADSNVFLRDVREIKDERIVSGVPDGSAFEWSEAMKRTNGSPSSTRSGAPLPFQLDVPLTGGWGPSIALPLGAAPFAFTIPLGGPPTPTFVSVNQTSPAAPPEPGSSVATSTPPDTPIVVANTSEPLYVAPVIDRAQSVLAESIVSAAKELGDDSTLRRSSSHVLRRLGNPTGDCYPVGSATALFAAFTLGRKRPRDAELRVSQRRYMLLARPGEPMTHRHLRAGDLLLRVARGQHWGRVAILVSPIVFDRIDLAAAGLRGEGYPRLLDGRYVHVIEPGTERHNPEHRFARRVCDGRDLVLPDTLLLRMRPQPFEGDSEDANETLATNNAARLHRSLRRGSIGEDVRTAQRALNRIHEESIAIGLPGLAGCPLPQDGNFDERMESAVIAFQQLTLSDPGAWNGVIGSQTWAQIDILTAPGTVSSNAPRPTVATEKTDEDATRPTLRQGSSGAAVTDVQARLNAVAANWAATSGTSLDACPLVIDGKFGESTYAAVRSFQKLAFPNSPKDWDGIVGPDTWARLDALAPPPPAQVPPVIRPPVPAPLPPPTTMKPVQAVDLVVPPSVRALDLAAQWTAHPRVHGWFESGFAQYQDLAPLYAANDIPDAAAYLDLNMVRLSFLGLHQDGHRDFIAVLEATEAAIASHPFPALMSFGCLNPRPIRGATTHLSKHALGRAIDLNPADNARITEAADFAVIAAVIGFDIRNETDASTAPARMRAASTAFQSGFTDAWIASVTDPSLLAALAIPHALIRLHNYASRGFCNLDLWLMTSLIRNGAIWGGTWHSSKDFMHFELP